MNRTRISCNFPISVMCRNFNVIANECEVNVDSTKKFVN